MASAVHNLSLPPPNLSLTPAAMLTMYEAAAIALVLLWLVAVVSACMFGGFVHLLVVLAFALVLARFIRGNKPFA